VVVGVAALAAEVSAPRASVHADPGEAVSSYYAIYIDGKRAIVPESLDQTVPAPPGATCSCRSTW
jgi:hypothetical protein